MISQHKEPIYPHPGPERLYLMYSVAVQDSLTFHLEKWDYENHWSNTTLTEHVGQVEVPMDLWSF